MTWSFFTWVRRWQNLPRFRAERPRRHKRLESIRKAKRGLDFELLEERRSAADAIGPFLTTTALAYTGQLVSAVTAPPVVNVLAEPTVRTQPALASMDSGLPPVELRDTTPNANHVDAGLPATAPQTPPAPADASAGGFNEGKPLFTALGQDSLIIDVFAGSKPTGTSGGTVDSGSGSSVGSGGGGGGGSASGGGQAAAASDAGAGGLGNLGGLQGGGGSSGGTSGSLAAAAPKSSITSASLPNTNSTPISPTGASPTGGTTPSAPSKPKHHDALWILDANNALVLTPGVTENDFSTYTVDLRGQVTSGTVTSYSWDTSQAPEATSISGSSSYRLQFTWANFTGANRTDSITLTVNTGTQTSQTITFNVASTTSPAYTATPPASASTWPTVLPPDAMTDGQQTVGLGPYYQVGIGTGELQTSHMLPAYHPTIAGLNLTYDSAAANAKPIFIVHYPIDSSQAVPPTVSAQLTLNGTSGQVYYYTTNGGATNPGDIMQIALQGDATGLATGRYSYSITATSNYATPVTTTYSGSVDVLNYSSNAFGAGWALSGVQRIYSVTGGVILDLGSGNSLWFANGQTQGTFNTPPGDTSTLTQSQIDSTYTRTLKDGTQIKFSSAGRQTSVVDRNGNTTTDGYNGSNQLTSITDFNSKITTLAYSAGGNVTSITDPANRITTLAYDASANLTSIKDADGSLWTYAYDSGHRVTTLTNPLNNTATLTYDFSGRVSGDTRPDATTESFSALQEQGLVQAGSGTQGSPASSVLAAQAQGTYTDPRTNAWNYRLDWLGFGQPSQATDPLSDMAVTHRDANGFPWMSADPLDNRTRTFFDSKENPTKVVQPDDTTLAYTYNGFSEVLQTTDQLNRLTTNSYDGNGNLTQVKDALNNLTTMTYTAQGFLATQKDALGRTTSYLYDSQRRLTSTTDANSGIVTVTYDSYGNQQTSQDQRGDTTTYAYDKLNRLTQTTDASANLTTSLYDAAGNLTASIDKLGHRTTYLYDALNRRTQTTDALNDLSSTVYDASGNVSASIDPLGHRTTYSLDAANRVTQTKDALGNLSTVVYDVSGNVLANVDQLGHRTSYSYDLLNRKTQTKDALGNLATTGYDAVGNVTVSIDQLGRRTTYSYDALNRKTQTQDALGNFVTALYDAVGNVTVSIDQLGHRTTSLYDVLNRNTVTTDAAAATTTITYDATGDRLTTTNPDGATTTYSYDLLSQQTLGQDALGSLTTTTYDAMGDVTQVQSQITLTTTKGVQSKYDALNRLTTSVDANGHVTTTVYDAAGNVINTIDAAGFTTTYAYDALNRRTAVTDGAGDTVTTVYDGVGNVTNSIDGLNHKTTYIYDVLNRKTQTVDARGGITTMLYDVVGNNTTVVDPVGNTTTMVYDALSRLTQQTDPLNHASSYAYDALSRQTSTTDRIGQRINTTFDNDGRVLGQVWKNSGGTTVDTLTYTYDSAGNQLTAANGSGAYTMSYDALNRVTLTQEPFGVTLTSVYDLGTRRTALQDSFGGYITSTYDKAGNLTDRKFGATGQTSMEVSLGYTNLNQLNSVGFNPLDPTPIYSNSSYDGAGRITLLQQAPTTPHVTFETYTYTYDAANRLTNEKRNNVSTTYQYDLTNQLTNDGTNSYSYDLNGNRNYGSYTTGSANELTNDGIWTYSYDNNGNLTKKSKGTSAETWYFGYDVANRMNSAKQQQTDGGTPLMQATYMYDVYGNRLEKDVWTQQSGTTTKTRFAYDGQNAFADLDGNNNNALLTRRLYGDAVDQLFARENSSGVAFYLTDRLGSVRDIVNGTVLDHIDYDGFGNATESNSPNGDRYKWTARELDTETGLQYNRTRFYASGVGRWTSQDPLAFGSADPNFYRYVANSPLGATDPSGLKVHITDIRVTDQGDTITSTGPGGKPVKGPPLGPNSGTDILSYGFKVTTNATVSDGETFMTGAAIHQSVFDVQFITDNGETTVMGILDKAHPKTPRGAPRPPITQQDFDASWGAFNKDPVNVQMITDASWTDLQEKTFNTHTDTSFSYVDAPGYNGEAFGESSLPATGAKGAQFMSVTGFQIDAYGNDGHQVPAKFFIFMRAKSDGDKWVWDKGYPKVYPKLPHTWTKGIDVGTKAKRPGS